MTLRALSRCIITLNAQIRKLSLRAARFWPKATQLNLRTGIQTLNQSASNLHGLNSLAGCQCSGQARECPVNQEPAGEEAREREAGHVEWNSAGSAAAGPGRPSPVLAADGHLRLVPEETRGGVACLGADSGSPQASGTPPSRAFPSCLPHRAGGASR